MLQEVLEYIHNYFIKAPYKGVYTFSNGTISPAVSLIDGQRFLIIGSVMNDGVYTWHPYGITDDDDNLAVGLQDETFAGTICALAVPPNVIALSGEISQWVENNSAALTSPMQSESFNGYSYTLKSGSGSRNGNQGGSGQVTWRDIYGKQLERWRKPCL